MEEKIGCPAGYAELIKKLQRLETTGFLYRALAEPQEFTGIYFSLQRYWKMEAASGQLARLRLWADFWRSGKNWQVKEERKEVLRGIRTDLPVQIVFSQATDIFAQLKLAKQATEFLGIYEHLKREIPEALPWLLKFPQRIMKKKFYPGCVALGRVFQKGIVPGQYLREINAQGIDTKFMERDMILTRTLWNVLHPDRIVANEQELYALWQTRSVEQGNIGVRMLDECFSWYGAMKFFLSANEAAQWRPPVKRIFITENKVNGYRFPLVPESMILFGMGYGVLELARKAAWMHTVEIYYWGDLDCNGFDILSKLREILPGVKSLLMSADVCDRYIDRKVKDEGMCLCVPQKLTLAEKQAWAIMRENGWRLEQERIPLGEVEAVLRGIESGK